VVALAFIVTLGLSVLAIFAFQAAADIAVELPPIVIFGAVTGAAAVLLVIGLSGSPARPTTAPQGPVTSAGMS
jgi:hypothetical protein